MNKSEKQAIVDDLATQLAAASCFYVVDSTQLTVEHINQLRRQCYHKGITYRVVKNTLIRRALDKLGSPVAKGDFVEKVLQGFSGIMIAQEAASAPAKLLQAFRKEQGVERPRFKGAVIEAEPFIGEEQLVALSKLKTKEELIGETMSLLQAPLQQVLGGLTGRKDQLMGVLETLSSRKESDQQ